MTTAEILSLASMICYIVAGISLVLAVFFWFAFKIPSVIADLSGRTARKSIAKLRASNEQAGGQGYKPSMTNVNRGKLTDTMPQSVTLQKDPPPAAEEEANMPETGLLSSNMAEKAAEDVTELLGENQEVTGLLADENATIPLQDEPVERVKRVGGKKLEMLDVVMYVHTDEVI